VIAERTRRYRAAVADGSSVPRELRDAVRYAAERVPLAIVSGAARDEIEPVVEAAGLAGAFAFMVTSDDIELGKPDPEGYVKALALFDDDLDAGDVLVMEDTEAGITSAKGAGMRCFAVLGTLAPERLRGADEIVERIDVPLMRRVFA
jgi:beta-phosphoglucomutase-like phosphatase (HAD superfamily)